MNFTILYASAAALMSSALLTLGVVVIWALGEIRLGKAPKFRVAKFTGSYDEAIGLDAPVLAQDVAA